MTFNCLSLSVSLNDLNKAGFDCLDKDSFDKNLPNLSFFDCHEDFPSYVSVLCAYESFLDSFSDSHYVVDGVNSHTLHHFLSFSVYPFYQLAYEKYEFLCDLVLSMLKVHPSLINLYSDDSLEKSLLLFLLKTEAENAEFVEFSA